MRIAITFIFLLLVSSVFCQKRKKKRVKQRFKAGLVAGVNLAQINGDLYTGYDKLGLHFGARGVMVLRPNLEASIELLYSQKGSQRSDERRRNIITRAVDIDLTYAETPILFNILADENEEEGFFRKHWQVGLSYGRLLKTQVEAGPILDVSKEVDYIALTPFFNGNDVSFIGGLTYYFSENFGLTLRHTVSLKAMYKNQGEDVTNQLNKWHSFFFTGQAVYMF